MTDLPEIYGVCRGNGCGYVWTREWEDGLCCPKCGETFTPMYPREAEARVNENRKQRRKYAGRSDGGIMDFGGLKITVDDEEVPTRPIIAMSGRQVGKSRLSSAIHKAQAGDVVVYGDQQFGVVRDVSIDGSHVEVIRDWKSEEDR